MRGMPRRSTAFDYPDEVPPGALFVAADEPMLIFPSVNALERSLEAIDVENRVYPAAYGPHGEKFALTTRDEIVTVTPVRGEVRPEELRALLLHYLEATHRSVEPMIATADLVQAIWSEEAAFWREHDPYGDRFASKLPRWGCSLGLLIVLILGYLLLR